MGSLTVPSGKLWGCQTQRSLLNFPIGGQESKMPIELVYAMATVKKVRQSEERRRGRA